MKKKKRIPQQVNTVAEPEEVTFTLEDIMREFGSAPAQTPPPTHNATPAQPPEPVAPPKPAEQPKPAVQSKPAASVPPTVPQPPISVSAAPESRPPQRPHRPEAKKVPVQAPKAPRPRQAPPAPAKSAPSASPRPEAPRHSKHTAPPPVAAKRSPAPPVPQPRKQAAKKPPAKKPCPAPQPAPTPEQLRKACSRQLGTSRLRLPLCAVLSVLLLALLVYQEYRLNWIPFLANSRTVGTLSVVLWTLCVLLAYNVLVKGFEQLFRLQIGLETLCAVSTVLVAIDAVTALKTAQLPYCAVSALGLTFALWGLSDGYLGNLHTLRMVQSAEEPKAIEQIPAAWNDKSGLFRSECNLGNFMRQLQQPDLTSKAMRIYSPIVLLLSLAISIYLSVTGKLPFVRAWMILLLGSTPLCGFLSYTRPFALLAKRLTKCGGAICGWAGSKIFSGRHILVLRDADVFPSGSISMNGVKLYSGYSMERVISYAAAVTAACESTLAPIFERYRAEQNCRRYSVGMYRYYEVGGVGAEVLDDVVLIGSLRFMNSMGVHMDAGMNVKQAVYLSINGELACVFAMKYKPSASVGSGLSAIARNTHLNAVLATRDFLITPDYLRYKYNVPADSFVYPSVKERLRLSEQDLSGQGTQGALLLKDNFSAFAHTVCGGRSLRTCVLIGTVVDLMAGAVGLILMLLLLFLDAIATASAFNLTLFLLVWTLPGLLLSRSTRRV